MDKNVCAAIVTYNRKENLLVLLEALKKQTYSLDAIFIFDNFSSDGTDKILLDNGYCTDNKECVLHSILLEGKTFYYYRNNENSGGSGGFNKVIKMTSELGFKYIWCMDDDVRPEENCLENLIEHISDDVKICIPTRTDENYKDYAITNVNMSNPFKYTVMGRKTLEYNESINGDIKEVEDMSFEGPLIDSRLISEIGLPREDFFILFDDSEYAMRACKKTSIAYCKKAVLHKQIIPKDNGSVPMNWKNYYDCRNQIWVDRHYGENIFVKVIRPRLLFFHVFASAILKRNFTNINVIKRAYKDGINDKLGKTVLPGLSGKDI